MALKDWVHRDQLFPRDAYRRAYDEVVAKHGDRRACRRRLARARPPNRAATERLAKRIDDVLDAGGIPDPKALEPEPGVLDIAPAVHHAHILTLEGQELPADKPPSNAPPTPPEPTTRPTNSPRSRTCAAGHPQRV